MTWPEVLLFPLIFVGLAVLATWELYKHKAGNRG